MTRLPVLVVALAVAVTAVSVTAQNSPMRAGRWEVTIQMEMPNMPVAMPAMKNVRCVTQQEIDSPNKGLPSGSKNPNDCKVSDYKVSGNTVTWAMACTGPTMTGTGELRFTGDAYEGAMKMMMEQQQMTMKMSGKRLGDCTQ
jgi:Protein of unknown function (DUF3617)